MKKLLPLLFLLFTTLYANNVGEETPRPTDVLPPLVKGGEPLTDEQSYYIDNRSPINAVAISPDGKTIVSGSGDGSIKIWNSSTGKLIRSLEGHTAAVSSVALSKDGKTIVSGSDDNSIKIWNSATGELIRSLEGHTNGVNSVALSNDGNTIVSGSWDNSIKIWNSATGKELKSLEGHKGSVYSVAISKDGKTIVSGSDDHSIKIWNSATGELIRSLEGHTDVVRSVALSKDGKTIVSGSADNSIKIWDSATGKELKSLEGRKDYLPHLVYSKGQYIIYPNENNLELWDMKTGELLKVFKDYKTKTKSITIDKDFKHIGLLLKNGVEIWNIGNKKRLINVIVENSENILLTKDKLILLVKGEIEFFDLKTGKYLQQSNLSERIGGLELSNNNKYLVGSSLTNTLYIFDMRTVNFLHSYDTELAWDTATMGRLGEFYFTNDDKYIYSKSEFGTMKIFDIQKGKIIYSSLKNKDKERGEIFLRKFKILQKKDEELIWFNKNKWIKIDYKHNVFYRVDEGTLLYKKNGVFLTPIYPKDMAKKDKLIIGKIKKQNIYNDQTIELNITLSNLEHNSYWIKANSNDNYCAVKDNVLSRLDKGKKGVLSMELTCSLPRINPKPINHKLNLTVTTANGSAFNKSVPIAINYADINVTEAEVSEDRKNLNLTIENIGDKALKNAKVKLLKPFVSNVQDIDFIEAKKSKPIAFAIDNNFSFEDNMSVALSVYIPNIKEQQNNPKTKVAPAYVWQVDNVTIVLNKLAWYIYALWVLTGVIVLWLIFYLRRYRNSLVLQLQREPKALLTLSPMLLSEAKKRLSKINELENILSSVGIEPTQLDEAISFDEQENKAALFAKRIPKSYLLHEGEHHKLACQKTELSVDDFLLYFTSKNTNEIEEQFKEDGNRVFVLGLESEREAIAKLARDKTNNIIAPTQEQWSEFLLSPKSQEVLMKILAACLEFSSISPYQTSKGVNKEVDFFGRIKIVRDIKMNSNRNYMIVGGRQLGKSSILKKLERSYAQSSSVDCRFINLEGKKGDIVLGMAQSLGLEEGATLEDVYNYIYQSDKKMLLLIDEVDEFIEPEIERDYETLKTLKNLAEEGKATFVFAGYWTLYQYVVADYQSPLYNFGELIVLEGLEKEACRELMIEPMQRIGLRHEELNYLDEVIEACGQRANLIATLCDEVLKEHEGKVIETIELKKAMQSNSLRDKLLGWDNMDALDKVIIYLTIEKSAFEFDEVLSLLEKEGIKAEASVVKKSLERLVIAYILKRDGGLFTYRVPIMRETVLKTNEKGRRALLRELLGKF